jgi:hypothetical protein
MSALERIAFHRGRRDEVPNQELARELAEARDTEGIREIAEHLMDVNTSVASDCIKVLYEVGYIDPSLVADYAEDFIDLLGSRQNRMVWGAMIGLWTVADQRADVIGKNLNRIFEVMGRGSVITVVSGVKALAIASSKSENYERRILPFLLDILEECAPKHVPQHAEAMLVMVNDRTRDGIASVLESRRGELSPTQLKRVERVLEQVA